MEPATKQDFRKTIPETEKRLEGLRLNEHFFVYSLNPWVDLYLLVFFLHFQTLQQVLFAHKYTL